MRAIVHIGMPKTGSTTIQKWLAANKAALARQGFALSQHSMSDPAKLGFHEVSIGLRTAAGLTLEPKSFMAKNTKIASYDDQLAFVQKFEAHLTTLIKQTKAHTLLFSAGDISQIGRMGDPNTAAAQVKAADTWLRQFFDDIRYVLYVRRPEDWFKSAYIQRLKIGFDQDFETYYENVRRFGDWSKLAMAWRDGAGADRFVLRIMERDLLHKRDLTEDFAQIAGINTSECKLTGQFNQAPSAAAVTFLQAINRRCAKHPDFAETRCDLVHELRVFLREETDVGPQFRLPDEVVRRIRSDFAQSNEVLRHTFFPDVPDLFPERAAPEPYPETSAAQTDGIAALAIEFAHWCLSKHSKNIDDVTPAVIPENVRAKAS